MLRKEPLAGSQASDYERVPGKAGRYRLKNNSGYELSRRQYDRSFGLLAKQGFTSYERRQRAYRGKDLTSLKGFRRTEYDITGVSNLDAALQNTILNAKIPPGSLMSVRISVRALDVNGKPSGRPVFYQTEAQYVYDKKSLEDEVEKLVQAIIRDIEDIQSKYGLSTLVIDEYTLIIYLP